MEQQVSWFWNGRWGRLARQDIKIYRDAGDHEDPAVYRLDLVHGGVEGRIHRWEHLDHDRAHDLADSLMGDGDGWRDMIS